MADGEFESEKRGGPLTVGHQVILDGKIDEHGENGVEGDEKEIIQLRPAETGAVESLNIKNEKMEGKKKGENHNIGRQGRDALARIDGNDLAVKSQPIGIEEGQDNSDDIAEKEKSDETCPLSSNHVEPLCRCHLSAMVF